MYIIGIPDGFHCRKCSILWRIQTSLETDVWDQWHCGNPPVCWHVVHAGVSCMATRKRKTWRKWTSATTNILFWFRIDRNGSSFIFAFFSQYPVQLHFSGQCRCSFRGWDGAWRSYHLQYHRKVWNTPSILQRCPEHNCIDGSVQGLSIHCIHNISTTERHCLIPCHHSAILWPNKCSQLFSFHIWQFKWSKW